MTRVVVCLPCSKPLNGSPTVSEVQNLSTHSGSLTARPRLCVFWPRPCLLQHRSGTVSPEPLEGLEWWRSCSHTAVCNAVAVSPFSSSQLLYLQVQPECPLPCFLRLS